MRKSAAQRIADAQALLRDLEFDPERCNERSAFVLLALLQLDAASPWRNSRNPMMRTVEIMAWISDRYGRTYKPNTRETIRRQTLHQFVDAGLIALNPDDPARAVNSPKNCYQLTPEALALAKVFGSRRYPNQLAAYRRDRPGLVARYARARHHEMLPVTLPDGTAAALSPGGQNVLLKQILEEFCPRWTPAGRVLYVGDAGRDGPVFDAEALADLGLRLDKHGKLPDLIVHLPSRDWLVLLEAAASHGPVDAKRHGELHGLFGLSRAGLILVSCFPTRAEMRKYLSQIAWETEVWCADAPSHLIHFNGERFLGPYSHHG